MRHAVLVVIMVVTGLTLATYAVAGQASPSAEVLVPQPPARWPGKIFVNHDQWPLSDSAITAAPDTSRFVSNLANWFTGGKRGKFLAYGCDWCFGTTLAATVTAAGHSLTYGSAADFTLLNLLQYDAVFLAASPIDNVVLVDYVHAGGNVYLAGGTGADDAGEWNKFLEAFNLQFAATYNNISGVIPIVSSSPIFTGVSALYQAVGNSLYVANPATPDAQVLFSYEGQGLYATYASGAIPVSVNIEPQECPNALNPRAEGLLRVAIAGSKSLDARTIDPRSVRLIGVAPRRTTLADVSRPVPPFLGHTSPRNCSQQGADGVVDLVLDFHQPTVVQGMEHALGRAVTEGDVVALTLTGNLKSESGGTPIVGEDLVVISRGSQRDNAPDNGNKNGAGDGRH